MSKPQHPTSSGPASPEKEKPASNENILADDIYQRGIEALHKELSGPRADDAPLSGLELNSVRALVSYVAYTHEFDEAVIRSLVEAYCDADDIKKIRQADFNKAITFLVDLDPRMIVN